MIRKKTHSGASKRFKRLKSNGIKAFHQGRRKKLSHKTRKRKRMLRAPFMVTGGDHSRLLKVL